MLEVWLPLLVIGAMAAWWYHVLRLREHVTAHARKLCEAHGLQLLDDSVALHRLRIRRRGGALSIHREYRFDTSTGGDDRRTASLTLVDNRITASSLPATAPAAPAPVSDASRYLRPDTDNVVSITRARRTLH